MAEGPSLPFLFGIYGIEVTGEMVRLLKEARAPGILLRRRNIETVDQVRTLIHDLEEALGYRLLVAVEHAGGVDMPFARGVTFFPGGEALAAAATPTLAYEIGRAMGRELRGMGINVDLAPILDLPGEAGASDLALRTFGSDPVLAAKLGGEMILGLQSRGVSAAARHFPGRGSAAGPAREILKVDLPASTLLERDLQPFAAAIAKGVDLIMTSGAVYPAWDEAQPALFSKRIVSDLLRKEMGFAGVSVTEDLSRVCTAASLPIEDAAIRALEAGNDCILMAHDYDLQTRAVQAVRKAVETGRLLGSTFEESRERLAEWVRRKRTSRPETGGEGEAASLAGIVAAAAVKVERDPGRLLPIGGGQRVGVLVPRMWDIADRVVVDDELRGAAGLIQGWAFSSLGGVDVLEVPIHPERDMVDLILDWAAALDILVFFCYDAHRFPGQRRLIGLLQDRCPKMVTVLIRNPQDRTLLKESSTVIQTYGFRVCQLAAAVNVLFDVAPAGDVPKR